MLNIVWIILVVLSSGFIIVSGKADFTLVLQNGIESATELSLSLLGIMAFWGGFMEIAEQSGITEIFSKILSPIIKPIFPELKNDKSSRRAISMNITANLLGLGNAATPLGVEAMRRMNENNPDKSRATDSMATFVVINTASVQLVPVTTAVLRAKYGSEEPMAILPTVLASSLAALLVGLIVDKALRREKI